MFEWLADLLPPPLCRRRHCVEAFQCGLCAATPVDTADAERVAGAVEALIFGIEVQVDVSGAAERRDLERSIAGRFVQAAQDRVEI
jgi:hypothetical protein